MSRKLRVGKGSVREIVMFSPPQRQVQAGGPKTIFSYSKFPVASLAMNVKGS